MRRIHAIIFIACLAFSANGQRALHIGGGLFPFGKTGVYTDPGNPAYAARGEQIRLGISGHDRFLLPELALERWQMVFPLKKGSAHFLATHYGNSSFREADLSVGYALPISERSSMGLRFGPSMVWMGEGHGQRFHWVTRMGVRSRIGRALRAEAWISDPQAAFRDPPLRELLDPGMTIGIAKRWPGPNTWSVHFHKELERPLRFRTRSSIRLHDRVFLLSGVHGLPLTPMLGWGMNWKELFLRLAATWEPTLGISPACSLIYRSKP